MDPAALEFLAEEERVGIVPNFSEGVLHLLGGAVGPFRAGVPLEVPLWLAVNLCQRQKCRLQQPDWMNPTELEAILDQEKESQVFIALPNAHMFVVAKLLLDVAIAHLTNADKIKTLIKDIWDIRQAKLRKAI